MPTVAFESNMVVPGEPQERQEGGGDNLAGSRLASPRTEASAAGHGVDNAIPAAVLGTEAPKPKPLSGHWLLHLRTKLRSKLANTSWYKCSTARFLREGAQSKYWAMLITLCLFLTLFLPQIWVLAAVNDNTGIDTVLTMVMVLFALEVMVLSVVDASYELSFFQLMDIIGTVSMITDISFMVGDSHTLPQEVFHRRTGSQLMQAKITDEIKMIARVGRLSRVLRMLRLLPFLVAEGSAQGGISSVISAKLSALLATRVASLSILLAMIIPFFDTFTFPKQDMSMKVFADRIGADIKRQRNRTVISDDLSAMVLFYNNRYDYGPYQVCIGSTLSACNTSDWVNNLLKPVLPGPARMASSLVVHAEDNNLMIWFNMHSPAKQEAGLQIASIVFVILIMLFSGLALSTVVNNLAVKPLERMLNTVRQIATTVFKLGTKDPKGHVEQGDVDIYNNDEMKLLEKVVQKLATIAGLQSKHMPQGTADMRDEDLGVLSILHGAEFRPGDKEGRNNRRPSTSSPLRRQRTAMVGQVKLEDWGVTQEAWNSWSFNPLPLTKLQRIHLAVYTISRFEMAESPISTSEDVALLTRFVTAAETQYLRVPFHSFAHALDVLHAVSRLIRMSAADGFLTELEQFGLLISAIGHDIGHPGLNNGFLTEVGHELAMQYNDKSPLENMHCAKLYTILGNKETNVFQKLSPSDYRTLRKQLIETILHTDMVLHQGMIKELSLLYSVNQEIFGTADQGAGAASGQGRAEVLSQEDNKKTVLNCLLHSADVSNPCRSWEVSYAWAQVCLEEFFAQGDQEKERGIPVQFLNDRDKLNKPNSQIGFIEFMIAPFVVAQIMLFPGLKDFGDNLATNLTKWEEMWIEESEPPSEERAKVKGRVEKVKASLLSSMKDHVSP